MNPFSRLSIPQRALLLGVLPSLLLFIALFSVSTVTRLDEARKREVERAQLLAQKFAAHSEYALISGNPVHLQSLFRAESPDSVIEIRVLDAQDRIFTVFENKQDIAEPDFIVADATVITPPVELEDPITGASIDAVAGGSDSLAQLGRVVVRLSLEPLHQTENRIIAISGVIGLSTVFLAIFLATIISRRIVQPLREVITITQDIAQGHLDTRIPKPADDELGQLQSNINVMAASLQSQQEILERNVQELRQARRAAEAGSEAKSEFIATVSHELRTPINGVLGMMDALEDTQLNDEQKYHISVARDASQQLLDMVSNVLDFSQIEENKLELVPEWLALDTLVDDWINPFRYESAKRNVALSITIDEQLKAHEVYADASRLRQILVNLVSNALKFTEQGEVRVSLTTNMLLRGQLELILNVADTGIGIEANKRALIFASFRQADSSTRRRFGGSGLGLAIVKRLTEHMQGMIDLRSSPGQGTEFTITIPCKRRLKRDADQGAALSDVQLAGRTVLVVEDNAINAMVTTAMLKKWSMNVLQADTGGKAIEIANNWQRSRADESLLVLMDCQLPDMDGFETTARFRAGSDKLKHAVIIALTANASDAFRERCLASGMDDFLSKPVNSEDLKQRLKSWCEQASSARSDQA